LQALICCPEQTISDRSTYPGKEGVKKREKRKRNRSRKEGRKTKKHKFTLFTTRGLMTFKEKEYIA
jgi:hypothetical protein